MSDIVVMRDIDIITAEIQVIEQQVTKAAIYGCIEIGKRLVEAKELVGHGNWGKYLAEKVRYSQQWATNLMNLYKEYGSSQESLFDSFANSQSFGNIDVTKHILLLAVPAEEREAFASTHDAETISTRELQAAIRDRDANLQAANEQAARAEKAEAEVDKLSAAVSQQAEMLDEKDGELSALEDKIVDLRNQIDSEAKKQADASAKVEKLTEQLKKARSAEKAAQDALKAAREHPEIPEAMMEEMRRQVETDAAAKATEDLRKQLDEVKGAAVQAEQNLLAVQKQLEEAEATARKTDGDMVLVSAYLEGVKDQFNKMVGAIKKVALADPETGSKLRQNVKDKLLPALMKAVEGA